MGRGCGKPRPRIMMSLYPTQEEAHAAFGAVFQHYKGGVYRAVEIRDGVATMEHLWPHPRATHLRPVSELFNDFIPEIEAFRFEPVTDWAKFLAVNSFIETQANLVESLPQSE